MLGSSSGTRSSSVSAPAPPHVSHTTLPPPKHSEHFVRTTPVPLQMSHSTTPLSVVSLPVPLHSSHFDGREPEPLHLPQLTSPLPLQVLHAKNENTDLNQTVGRLTNGTQRGAFEHFAKTTKSVELKTDYPPLRGFNCLNELSVTVGRRPLYKRSLGLHEPKRCVTDSRFDARCLRFSILGNSLGSL